MPVVYWIIPALVVLACIAFGFRDFGRLRLGRVLAISDACFVESIRRKVLLVTPLAILGVIIIVQLQEPATEQDAIRQTTRFCLFASGLLVAVVAIILACTNLPREIENRVIYTIVTKPTTRLEIVIGKVVGFARVSAAILLIMGAFSYGYLKLRDWQLVRNIDRELAALPTDSPLRPTLAYYASAGLLTTKSVELPANLQVYSRAPESDDRTHYAGGGQENYFTVPFQLSADQIAQLKNDLQTGVPLILHCDFRIIQHTPNAQQLKDIKNLGLRPKTAKPSAVYGPAAPSTQSAPATPALQLPTPQVKVRLFNPQQDSIADFGQIDGLTIDFPPTGEPSFVVLKPEVVESIVNNPRFTMEFSAITPAVEYGVDDNSVILFAPTPRDPSHPSLVIRSSAVDGGGDKIEFLSRSTRYGMQLIARSDGSGPVAVYQFSDAPLPASTNDAVPFEISVIVERGGDFDPRGSSLSHMSVQVFNRTTGKSGEPILLTPELGRSNYVDIPRDQLTGGNFDLMIRGLSPGQLLDVKPDSVSLIAADKSFAFNLFKSLFILWMLSVLVVIIAVFCSTFLSWPIAVILTLVLLLGHWGVSELGDAMNHPGRSVSTDFGLRDPVSSKVVSTSVDQLAAGLKILSDFLPDVSKFPVMEDIEANVSIPMSRVEEALGVLLMFGLPLLCLSYIILKNKEVAP